ncbi:MAG: hypothetical protein NTV56_00010 [Alphaproteobacteria bacterium]|nr:hypothetical protein [Alphaproteobacteria bacterium]
MRFLLREQPLGVARQLQKLDALFHVGFLGILVPFDGLKAHKLFSTPLVRHLVEERRVDQAVELVDIHGIDALLKPPVFGLLALDRLFVFPALISVAGMKRIPHPFEHVIIEAKPPE